MRANHINELIRVPGCADMAHAEHLSRVMVAPLWSSSESRQQRDPRSKLGVVMGGCTFPHPDSTRLTTSLKTVREQCKFTRYHVGMSLYIIPRLGAERVVRRRM